MRDLEFAWATFLTRGMDQGVIPEADARLLTRAILGLYNSVWHWYRPGGDLSLADVRDFYVARCLAVAGLPLPAADGREPGSRRSRAGEGGAVDRDRLAVAPRLAARDRHVVDLVGPVDDLQDPRDRVELGEQDGPATRRRRRAPGSRGRSPTSRPRAPRP